MLDHLDLLNPLQSIFPIKMHHLNIIPFSKSITILKKSSVSKSTNIDKTNLNLTNKITSL